MGKVSPLAWACARSDADRSNRLGGDHAHVPLSALYPPRALFAPIIFRPCRHGCIICRIGPCSLRRRTVRPCRPTPSFPPSPGGRNPKPAEHNRRHPGRHEMRARRAEGARIRFVLPGHPLWQHWARRRRGRHFHLGLLAPQRQTEIKWAGLHELHGVHRRSA